MGSLGIKCERLKGLWCGVVGIVWKGSLINIGKMNEIKVNRRLSGKMSCIEYCWIKNKGKNGGMGRRRRIVKLKRWYVQLF